MKRMRAMAGRGLAAAGLAAAALAPAGAWAEQLPLWELGLGVGALSFPAYRGSDETKHWVLPVPYVVYRGEIIKADRRGLRGILFDSERVELSLSVAASPPASSSDVKAREGMPDLEPTVEVGPSLNVTLWQANEGARRLALRMPLRRGITVEGSPQSTGWLFTPHLNLDWRDAPQLNGWRVGLLAGPIFGDARQHRYFYSVDPRFATPQRPAYEADGGYAGSQFLVALSKRYPGYWVGAFVRYDTLGGAVFEDSPLVKTKNYFAAGVAISWILGQSSERVEAYDED